MLSAKADGDVRFFCHDEQVIADVQNDTESAALVDTGIEGLNDVLHGGLSANRLYLLEGRPGSGKTTLALQFLMAGVAAGERCIYVTLSETLEALRAPSRGFLCARSLKCRS